MRDDVCLIACYSIYELIIPCLIDIVVWLCKFASCAKLNEVK